MRMLGSGGQGYCYDFDRGLFAGAEGLLDGPLVIALDSNVLIDIESHGMELFDDNLGDSIPQKSRSNLIALADLLEAWLVRDIRFIVVPPTREDFKRTPTPDRLRSRDRFFSAVEEALTFQLDDWGEAEDRLAWTREPDLAVAQALMRVPDDLDRAMVEGAWACGADVFLTQDRRLLSAMKSFPEGFPNVCSPADLSARLFAASSLASAVGPTWLTSGTVSHSDCHWAGGLPFGDTGKWGKLLEALA